VKNPGFGRFWFGESISVLGDATTKIMLPLLAVVTLHAGPVAMGVITAAAWLPWLVIGLPAGAWVDRIPARTVMIVADVVSAVALATVPLAWAAGVLGIAQLVMVAGINGTSAVFFRAAYPVLVQHVVPAEQLTAATGRLVGVESASQVVGPGLAGGLIGLLGAAGGLLLDAVSFLVSAACLWRVPSPPHRRVESRPILVDQIRRGLRAVYRDRYLRWFTISGGVSNFGLTGYTAILVLFLVRDVGLDSSRVGLVFALGAVGGVLGASVANRAASTLGSARAVVVLQLVSGPVALLLAFAAPGARVALVPVALFFVGLGVVAGNVVKVAFRMQYLPPDVLGRAVTASQLVNYGTMPLAGLSAGWLGSTLGLRATIAIMAGVHASASLAIMAGPIARLRDLPTRSATDPSLAVPVTPAG
jgi:MFS family permease